MFHFNIKMPLNTFSVNANASPSHIHCCNRLRIKKKKKVVRWLKVISFKQHDSLLVCSFSFLQFMLSISFSGKKKSPNESNQKTEGVKNFVDLIIINVPGILLVRFYVCNFISKNKIVLFYLNYYQQGFTDYSCGQLIFVMDLPWMHKTSFIFLIGNQNWYEFHHI